VNVPSAALLAQIHRVAEELPALILDSIARVLMVEATATVKGKLLSLLPKPAWRQAVSLLLDRWQAEAVELDGQAIALALATAAHCQATSRQKLSVELVWTGPNPEALPLRRTDQTLLQLIRSAKDNLLIISFAIYNIPEIVQALTEAIDRGVNYMDTAPSHTGYGYMSVVEWQPCSGWATPPAPPPRCHHMSLQRCVSDWRTHWASPVSVNSTTGSNKLITSRPPTASSTTPPRTYSAHASPWHGAHI